MSRKMEFIDYKRKVRLWVEVLDAEGEMVDFGDTVNTINQFIKDKISANSEDQTNKTLTEIYPLMAQLCSFGIGQYTDQYTTALILSNPSLRMAVLQQMMLSHYFIKFIQKNNFKIVSYEEPISEEEIQKMFKIDKINSIATMGSLLGLSQEEVVDQMIKSGNLTKEDAEELGIDLSQGTSNESNQN